MILCDIGNSFLHFYQNGKVWKERADRISNHLTCKEIFYISVSSSAEEKFLKVFPHAICLEPYALLDSAYVGLGIDRKCACLAINSGLIIDAGSAITIDIMHDGTHLGGYILPGISSYIEFYAKISERLNIMPDLSLDLDLIPQNTKEAISLGMLKSIIGFIREQAKGKIIYFAGGDGKFLSKFFDQGFYNEILVFEGMLKVLEKYYEMHP